MMNAILISASIVWGILCATYGWEDPALQITGFILGVIWFFKIFGFLPNVSASFSSDYSHHHHHGDGNSCDHIDTSSDSSE